MLSVLERRMIQRISPSVHATAGDRSIRERVGEAAVERCVVSVVGPSVHASREKGDRLHRDYRSNSTPAALMCHVHLHTVGTTETQHQLSSLQQENRL